MSQMKIMWRKKMRRENYIKDASRISSRLVITLTRFFFYFFDVETIEFATYFDRMKKSSQTNINTFWNSIAHSILVVFISHWLISNHIVYQSWSWLLKNKTRQDTRINSTICRIFQIFAH